jgi:hypothetical protein
MDVIPLDATLIKGSHGRVGTPVEFHPVIISNDSLNKSIHPKDVYNAIWDNLN